MLAGLQDVPIRFLKHENWLRSEMRVSLNRKKVEQYAREKGAGHRFPSPVVFVDPDGLYWIGDGFHRVEADALNGREAVEVFVKPGALKDAILWNLKANRESQGLPFSSGDLTKAAKVLLANPDFAGMTYVEMAKAIGCSATTVHTAAKALGLPKRHDRGGRGATIDRQEVDRLRREGLGTGAIAVKLGVSPRSVHRALRADTEPCPHCGGSGRVPKAESSAEDVRCPL